MTEQIREIGMRLRALREILDISPEEMAKRCGVSIEDYFAYERGEKDFSFSFLFNAAEVLGVDVLDLMSGDSPKLSTCSLVRAGKGFKVERRQEYSYMHLAYTFRNKKADPFLVTVMPEELPQLHGHEGQEFQYLLEGEVLVAMGESHFVLYPGDAVYFDSATPHAITALNGKPAKFLAVVIK